MVAAAAMGCPSAHQPGEYKIPLTRVMYSVVSPYFRGDYPFRSRRTGRKGEGGENADESKGESRIRNNAVVCFRGAVWNSVVRTTTRKCNLLSGLGPPRRRWLVDFESRETNHERLSQPNDYRYIDWIFRYNFFVIVLRYTHLQFLYDFTLLTV